MMSDLVCPEAQDTTRTGDTGLMRVIVRRCKAPSTAPALVSIATGIQVAATRAQPREPCVRLPGGVSLQASIMPGVGPFLKEKQAVTSGFDDWYARR